MCESTRGEWGKVCPDCGKRLPKPKPLSSWHSTRNIDFERSEQGRMNAATSPLMGRAA